MWILKQLFEWLAKFFGTKAGKTTAKVMAGVGIGVGGIAAGEIVVAHKRNKRAEAIKAKAIKKHDDGRMKVENTLAALGETKLEVYHSFEELADVIGCIQQRPEIGLRIEGIELPRFDPAEFKRLAMAVEVAVGGAGGVVAGGAVGVAIMGTGSLLALAPGILFGGVVLCAMGAKMLYRSAEKVKLARKIESDVEEILAYYRELDRTAKRFHKAFTEVQEPFFKSVRKIKKTVAKKADWAMFSSSERIEVKTAICLAQLLCHMCSIELIHSSIKGDALEQVNTEDVDRAINEVRGVREQMKMGTMK